MAWAADFVGLSAVVGAFFGGLAIRQTPQYKEVQSSVSAEGDTYPVAADAVYKFNQMIMLMAFIQMMVIQVLQRI